MSRQSLNQQERDEQERDEAVAQIRDLFPIGATVHTVLRHVSRSGMRRSIAVLACRNGAIWDVSGLVAKALGYRFDRNRDGVIVNGAGMDMGFSVVYNLARVLYRDGFPCSGAGCLSNDHANEWPSQYTLGRLHSDPGYALRHRWV